MLRAGLSVSAESTGTNQETSDRLVRQQRGRLEREQAALASLAGRQEALSPLAVLDRGYALVRDAASGRIVRDASATAPGDRLAVRVARGRLTATVDDVDPSR